jgi:glycosyltransferase involved in cell wall biosynthesis
MTLVNFFNQFILSNKNQIKNDKVLTYVDYQNRAAHPNRIEGGLRLQERFNVRTDSNLPLISVITVVRNGEKTIEKTIQSVLDQTYNDIEYIIIDGCSSDRTISIIKKYEHKIAYWLSEPDEGIYDAMNKGISLASGDWIHLLNSDDRYYDRTVLEKAVNFLDVNQTNYFTLVREFPDRTQEFKKFDFQKWELYILPKIAHPTLIVSKKQYEQVGLYDNSWKIASDHEFTLRLIKKYPGHFTDIPLVVMVLGGFGFINIKTAYSEFRDVTILHGMPKIIALMIYLIKILYQKTIVKYKIYRKNVKN